MEIRNKIKVLGARLEEYFKTTDDEWIDLKVVFINMIDIKIVSNKAKDIKSSELFIKEQFDQINNEQPINKFEIGTIELFTTEEAEDFFLEKPKVRELDSISFGSVIESNLNNYNIRNKSNEKSKVISFYSYKGGVGRTVALIQTAYALAEQGKKVAIIDLDIEAPSFNDIFKDDIKNEYGLVKHLYNKMYNITEKNESNRLEGGISKLVNRLNLNTEGDIYAIPAGNIDLEYVRRLECLKEKVIYENRYIQEVIDELTREYSLDYVLIDTRTGINNWGALSVIDVADEVFLFGYPNTENIKGLKLILDIIKENKPYNVIISRIPASREGRERAEELFEELGIEQEFIPIFYDTEIALANKYPIASKEDAFKAISGYILEKEKIKINKKIISDNKEILRSMMMELIGSDYLTSKIMTNNDKKILEWSNYIVVKNKNIDVAKMIKSQEKKAYILNNKENKLDNRIYDWLSAYVESEMDNTEKSDKCMKVVTSEILLKYLYEVDGNNYYYLKFKNDGFTEKIYMELFDKVKQKAKFSDGNIGIMEISHLKMILNQFVEFKILNKGILEEEYVRFASILMHTLSQKNDIKVNILIDEVEYFKDINIYEKYNANIINLSYKDLSKTSLVEVIKEIFSKVKLLYKDILIKRDNFDLVINDILTESLLPKRINDNTYSREIEEWLAGELASREGLCKEVILNIIVDAINIERSSDTNGNSSIISFESIKKATNKLLESI